MHKNTNHEKEMIRRRMEELFRDFYHAGMTEPSSGYALHGADNREHGAKFHSMTAAGGRHDHKD